MKEKFMLLAYKEALKAFKKNEVPVGAVLVKNNEVIAKAYNQKEKTRNSLKHAEIIVLEKAQKKLNDWHFNDMELYVTMEPCAMCAGAIINFRVGKVYFGAYDERYGCITSTVKLFDEKSFNHHPYYEGGILQEECSKILTDFFKNKRNEKKNNKNI